MSKITNDGLTRSGAGCCIAVAIWQQWVVGVSGLFVCVHANTNHEVYKVLNTGHLPYLIGLLHYLQSARSTHSSASHLRGVIKKFSA